MASRTKQKEEARARRVAEERALAERARRQRRLQMLGGVVLLAVILVAVAIAISSSGGSSSAPSLNSAAATQAASQVQQSLSGIPQSGNVLGSPTAKVTVTEFGDLKCPVCRSFALGAESSLISNDVRAGRVKLVYRALCTATCAGPQPGIFSTQQAAAIAAGLQNLEWNYVSLFYRLQGDETTSYVSDSWLASLAGKVPGLNFSKWQSDRNSSTATTAVTADQQAAASRGFSSTPTIVVKGPKGEATPIQGDTTYAALESAIKSVQ